MPTVPIHNLTKKQIVFLANRRCKHSHTYLEHYQCYQEEQNAKEKIGHLDIEFYNFDANYGRMISYCILDDKTGKIYSDTLKVADIRKGEKDGTEDARLVANCIKDMLKFDRVVTFYGKRCDVPYIRTRALMCGVDFPFYGSLNHTDLYFIVKYKFKLNRNGLENSCRSLLGKTEKTHVDNPAWMRAMRGDAKSIKYILDHNVKDVRDTKRLYHKIINFIKQGETSI
jgi:uncharacterized protein YprB with RNaseH-like and TPR domain